MESPRRKASDHSIQQLPLSVCKSDYPYGVYDNSDVSLSRDASKMSESILQTLQVKEPGGERIIVIYKKKNKCLIVSLILATLTIFLLVCVILYMFYANNQQDTATWSSWTYFSCDVTSGKQFRKRECSRNAEPGGEYPCKGQAIEIVICPVHGNWSVWTSWASCDYNEGMESRKRFCNNPSPKNNGRMCPGTDTAVRLCEFMRYEKLGLRPVFSMANGTYPIVRWDLLKGKQNYLSEWERILRKESAQLHFPPLMFTNAFESYAVLLYMTRVKDSLVIYGGYHEKVDKATPAIPIGLDVQLQFKKLDGSVEHLRKMAISKMHHIVNDKSYATWMVFNNIPWDLLSAQYPPEAHISMEKVEKEIPSHL